MGMKQKELKITQLLILVKKMIFLTFPIFISSLNFFLGIGPLHTLVLWLIWDIGTLETPPKYIHERHFDKNLTFINMYYLQYKVSNCKNVWILGKLVLFIPFLSSPIACVACEPTELLETQKCVVVVVIGHFCSFVIASFCLVLSVTVFLVI